jgi:SAM-dependent methyltransferase
MPTYPGLPTVKLQPFPEGFWRALHEKIEVRSLLDVGAGHGGVHDYGYWDTRVDVLTREACDLTWIRPMGSKWSTRVGVDVQRLSEFYPPKSFDIVQCFEVLEHVPEPRRALEALCAVARKMVLISSADEMHHQGPEQEAIEKINPAQAYVGQPKVADLVELGFDVWVDAESQRQLLACRRF